MTTIPYNFLGLPREFSEYKKSKYVILPVPYDATVSYRTGSREGPSAILAASRQVERFDPQLGKEIHFPGIATVDPIEPDARGPEQTMKELYTYAKKNVSDGKFLIALGGEHSISSALVKAVQTRHKKLSVLHIDAHLDMRNTWQGSKFSHACVIRRIHELGVNTVSLGIRNISQEEFRYVKKTKQTVLTAEQICLARGDDWITNALAALNKEVYVTIDIDGFDPAVAPGTGTPEPGGLDWYHVTKLLNALTKDRQIVGADIVEVLPLPGQVVTEFLAAKLAAKIIALTTAFHK
ncbi:MAG: agmatinase [Phycisphaerae bacterium]